MDRNATEQGIRARPPGLFHKLNRTHERDVFVYERLVEAIRSGAIQHEEGMTVGAYGDNFQFVDFPPRLRHLACGVRSWRTPDKGLVVSFLYVPGLGRHLSDYVYSSTGDFSEGHLQGMRVQCMITTNWCVSY